MTHPTFGGQTMTGRLERVLVGDLAHGWTNPDGDGENLGFHHPIRQPVAAEQHGTLVDLLKEHGVLVETLPAQPPLTGDAIYVHDPSLVTDAGAILLSMGKAARNGEPAVHGTFYQQAGIPVIGSIERPGTVEAGDLVWLDPQTLLAGHGYRTNRPGIEQLAGLLAPRGITVVEAPLPHGEGPGSCLHLMSLMSLLSATECLVDMPWLAVPTLRLLAERGFDCIPIETAERNTMAANVLALGERELIAIVENKKTNALLADRGFVVHTFPGSEICQNGGGGPTCLTRPLRRQV